MTPLVDTKKTSNHTKEVVMASYYLRCVLSIFTKDRLIKISYDKHVSE